MRLLEGDAALTQPGFPIFLFSMPPTDAGLTGEVHHFLTTMQLRSDLW
jgi:hypothetical protein